MKFLQKIFKRKDSPRVRGFVRLQTIDKNGKVLDDTGFKENVITNLGLAALAGLAGNVGAITAFSYLAVGSDATAATAAQTTLVAEITTHGLARTTATVTRSTTNQTNDTLQFDYTWTVTGTDTINEIGIFNASSNGIMLARKVTGSKPVVNGYSIAATYKIIFA